MAGWRRIAAASARLLGIRGGRAEKPRPDVALEILSQADVLVQAGNIREAIDYATERNETLRDPRIEQKLVVWRRAAFEALEKKNGRPDWPPAVSDLFAGVQGPPEVRREDLTPEILASAIQHHGCLIVRGLIAPSEVRTLVDGIGKAFDACAAAKAGASVEETAPWYSPFPFDVNDELAAHRSWVENGGGVWTADSPRMTYDLVKFIKQSGIDRLIGSYLGETPALSIGKWTLRKVPPTTGTDWHQDGAFLGSETRTVNLWITLSDCGVDAPGLDIVSKRIPHIVPTGSHGAWFDWSVGSGMVDIVAEGTPVMSPVFSSGDAVLFDNFFLHRTGVKPGMTRDRWAIESWFFAPSAYPAQQMPLYV